MSYVAQERKLITCTKPCSALQNLPCTGGQKWASGDLGRPHGEIDQQTFEAHSSHHHGAYESQTPTH
jgi:hypothetical protein